MAAAFEVFHQLDVVEDFAVERDPQRLVFVVHRLMPAADVDDREPHVPQRGLTVGIRAASVRPAMADRMQHSLEQRDVRPATVTPDKSGNPAHRFPHANKEARKPNPPPGDVKLRISREVLAFAPSGRVE